jgi:serine/threonine-protein kinase
VKSTHTDSFIEQFSEGKKRRRYSFGALWRKISEKLASLAQRLDRRPPIRSSRLFAAAFVSICICAIAAAITVFSLFGAHLGKYEAVTVPDLTSLSRTDALSIQNDLFEYEISYCYNPNVSDDSVISQTPHPGVSRKLYRNDDKIKLTLVVNKKREPTVLPNLLGACARDAELFLKNAGANVKIFEEYSDTCPKGNVILCSHPEGTKIDVSETVILRVSKGAQTLFITVPSLLGLGENQASEKLEQIGFSVGKITYTRSKEEIGTVIAQEYEEGTSLPMGTKISIVVSGGLYFE